MANFKILSMYTPDTPYEKTKDRLIESMEKFNLDYKMYKIENRGSWVKNCQQNAEIIMDYMLKDKETPVVYVDCDAEFIKYPELFNELDCDIAYHIVRYPEKDRLCTGTLYLNNSMMAWEVVMAWKNLNDTNDEFDDNNLQSLMAEKYKNSVSAYELPEQYCSIHINRVQKGNDPVIKHWQASRQYKKVINGRN